MVIIPHKLIYLATPRTGSRALSAAFAQVAGAKEFKLHHVRPEDIDLSAEALIPGSSALRRCTVIRDPYTQSLSVFYHVCTRHMGNKTPTPEEFLRFLDETRISWWFDDRLYPYHEAADDVFLYEPDLQFTMQEIADHYDIFPCPIVQRIGTTRSPHPSLLTPEAREKINARFPEDIRYYYDLCG